MIVQHRLIGNIPGRGHGEPLLSPAFPLDSALAMSSVYRSPDPGHIPAEAGKLSSDGRYHIRMTTFEIQSTHFGRPILLSANVFRPANSVIRPLIYMNTVAMTDENGAPINNLTPEALLSFDQFITPSQFVALNAATKYLNAETWVPANPPLRSSFLEPKSAAHRALLKYYWSAASSRMFSGNIPVFSVCLGKQVSCEEIIENAKALLLCDILPYLPAAVNNIVSMSASVLESNVRTLFKDSAMSIVFPPADTDSLQPTFDFRSNVRYPSLSELEDQFISAVLEGRCTLMNELLELYASMPDGCNAARTSFAADYDFSLLLYQLERTILGSESLIPAEKLITAWKVLNSLLISRHRLTEAQVNFLLADIEVKVLAHARNIESAVNAVTTDDLPALWRKALTGNDSLFPILSDIIAASPAASSFLNMLVNLPELDFTMASRTAKLVANICKTHFTKFPFTADQIDRITAEPLFSQLRSQPEVLSALSEGLLRSNQVFADSLLDTLPISILLLDGRDALAAAVSLLQSRHLHTLPTYAQISNLVSAYAQFADASISEELLKYFAACLPAQISDLCPLFAMISAVLPSTDAIIPRLLNSAQESNILLDCAQTNLLFGQLLPKCSDCAQVAKAYIAYECNMTTHVVEHPIVRIQRLCDCSSVLSQISFDSTEAICGIINSFASGNMLFTKEQAQSMLSNLWPLCQNMNAVRNAFRQYMVAISSNDPLRCFSNAIQLDGFGLFLEHLHEDAYGILYNIFVEATHNRLYAPLHEIDAFFSALLPHCVLTSAIAHQLIIYINKSVEHAENSSSDLFPWLVGMIELAKKHRLITLLTPYQLVHITVRYLCSRHSKLNLPLTADAYDFVREFALQVPGEFSAVSADVCACYDKLLQPPAESQTEAQVTHLLSHFSATNTYPNLCEFDKRTVCTHFCNAMLKSGYDNAFSVVDGAMKRCGMNENELLERTQTEARAALDRKFSAFKKITEYEKAFRTTTAPRDLLHNTVLREHFSRLRDLHLSKPLSLEQLDRLNSVSLLMGISANSLPQIIRNLSEVMCRPSFDSSPFVQCMEILRQNQIDPASISKEITGLLKDNIPCLEYPQNIHAAILCNLTSNAKNVKWKQAFTLLGMPVPEKMPKPFSAEGQLWLAFIHAVFRALDLLEPHPNCSYGRQMIDYLCSGDFSEFTSSVLTSNPKQLAIFYPEYPARSPFLNQWLSR